MKTQHLAQTIQHKAEIATTVAASSASVTWIEQANAYVDLAAGVIAVISGCLAIAWYVTKFVGERRNGSKENSER